MKCAEVAPLLPFFVCDELEPFEREAMSAHIAQCAECAAQLEEERTLVDAFAALSQPADRLNPSDILLAQCRSELAETLDDLTAPAALPQWQPFGWFRRFMTFRPAWSAALLLLMGLVIGARAPEIFRGGNSQNSGRTMNVRATPQLSEEQLAKMAVAGINFSPSSEAEPGTVRMQLRAEQPLVLSGNADDTDVRRVLTYVVENGQQFDAGVRLDCLDALKAHTKDDNVRRAFLTAARKDANPAIRLKALDALRASTKDEAVREALLDALEHDVNQGVRVEAINLLVRSLQPEDDEDASMATLAPPTASSDVPIDPSVRRVLRALEDLTRKDPNRYVRLRTAAALRQIGPRETQ